MIRMHIGNGQLKTYIAIVPLNPKHSFNKTFEEIPKIILRVDCACLGCSNLQATFEHLNDCLVSMWNTTENTVRQLEKKLSFGNQKKTHMIHSKRVRDLHLK
jgi:hypothetical protein